MLNKIRTIIDFFNGFKLVTRRDINEILVDMKKGQKEMIGDIKEIRAAYNGG